MSNTKIQSLCIPLLLMAMVVTAFWHRSQIYRYTDVHTIDEHVYLNLAVQVSRNFSDYNIIHFGKVLAAQGRDLPEYFSKPLFKHPPVFTLLSALSIKIFGTHIVAVHFVSLLFGVLLIPLAYLLGKLVADEKVGFLAAVFVWQDPVSIICSLKTWMDTCVAFFTVLSIYLFAVGLKNNKDKFYIFAGICSGLAASTKYTGFLATICIVVYTTYVRRDLYKNRNFLIGLLCPFIVLLPWFYWNYNVYGFSFFSGQVLMHLPGTGYWEFITEYKWYGLLIILMIPILLLLKSSFLKKSQSIRPKELETNVDSDRNDRLLNFAVKGVLFVLAGLVFQQFIHSFQIAYVPTVSWHSGFFANEPPTFYIGRLLEYSLVYVFAFIGLFVVSKKDDEVINFLKISTVLILLFFIVWKNYQSRYILPVIPLLLVLAAQVIISLAEHFFRHQSFYVRIFGKVCLWIFAILIGAKLTFVNLALTFTNNMCYF